MLKKWIEEIRDQPDLYKSNCWKYHLSGNVIEFSIMPAYMKRKKSYRCSVIAIGQVLNALSRKIEEEQLNFHIQSFPNLENPEIVATIRSDLKNDFTDCSQAKKINGRQKQDTLSIIHSHAKKYQLDMQTIENTLDLDSQIIPFDDYLNWIVLYSSYNNPFTWLNIGYLTESLRSDFSYTSKPEHLCIFDFCSLDKEKSSKYKLVKSSFLNSFRTSAR